MFTKEHQKIQNKPKGAARKYQRSFSIPKKTFYEIHHKVMKRFWECLNVDYSDIGKISWKKLYKKMPKTKKEIKDLVYKLKN